MIHPTSDAGQFDLDMMRQAVHLAMRGIGKVEPNPLVGAMIVNSHGKQIGAGYHAIYGGPHAEITALSDAVSKGAAVQDSTIYVTLEPCNHHGKTPPCTDAIISAGIRRVVYGRADPNPRAQGGAERLLASGIACDLLELPETLRLTASFCKRMTTGLPWVIVKWAQTVDGAIATRDRLSRWISNEKSRASVHRLRARVDAVMTGVGTVLADDPMLTPRRVRRINRHPIRVIVDPALAIPLSAKVITTAREYPTILAVDPEIMAAQSAMIGTLREQSGVEVMPLPTHSLREFLILLSEKHNVTRLLVEAGGGLVGQLIKQGMVDELIVYIAPRLLGDVQAMTPVRGFTARTIQEATRLRLVRVNQFDEDVRLIYRTDPSSFH